MPHARTHTLGSHPFPFAGGGNDVSSFRCLQIDSVTITKSLINSLPSVKAIFFFRVKSSVNTEFGISRI